MTCNIYVNIVNWRIVCKVVIIYRMFLELFLLSGVLCHVPFVKSSTIWAKPRALQNIYKKLILVIKSVR